MHGWRATYSGLVVLDRRVAGGYSRHNQIVREVLQRDEVVDEQLLAVNDALVMYSPLLEDGSQPAAD